MNSNPEARPAGPESGLVSRHERVLDEAARQLNTKGVSPTSLREIAAVIGISRPAMYHYVQDREDLVFQCYRNSCEITARNLAEAIRSDGNPIGVVAGFIERTLAPNAPEAAARIEAETMNPQQRHAIQGLHDSLAAQLAQILDAGKREGSLRGCDADVNSRAILSVIEWAPLALRRYAHLGPLRHSRIVEAVKSTILDGLSMSRGTPSYRAFNWSPLRTRLGEMFDRATVGDAKREAITKVASRLFNRKGIDATSLEEIAVHLGATKRTVHRYFGSKLGLVEACHARTFTIFRFINDSMTKHQGSCLEALTAAFQALAISYSRRDLSPLLPLVGFGALSDQARAAFARQSAALAASYADLIKRGIREGSVREIDIEAHMLVTLGPFSWLVKGDVPTDPPQSEHIAREVATLMAIGLRAVP